MFVTPLPTRSQNSQHQTHITEIPHDIQLILFGLLDTKDAVSLGSTSKYFCSIAKDPQVWETRLNDDGIQKLARDPSLTAKNLFIASPQYRQDKHVPTDQNGLNYLRSLGITNPIVIKYISLGLLTIDESRRLTSAEIKKLDNPRVQQFINKGQLGKKIIECLKYLNEDGQLQTPRTEIDLGHGFVITKISKEFEDWKWTNSLIQRLFDAGLVTIPQILSTEINFLNKKILDSSTLQKYLLENKITFQEVSSIFAEQGYLLNLEYLDNSETVEKIETGEITIKDALIECFKFKKIELNFSYLFLPIRIPENIPDREIAVHAENNNNSNSSSRCVIL